MSNTLVAIGDVYRSRNIEDRESFQERFQSTIQDVETSNSHLLSPYTITLGDEFQAVFRRAEGLFTDLTYIMAELMPHRLRFALSIGPLSTPINKEQAIGMDGPAFRSARETIEELKERTEMFAIVGLSGTSSSLINTNLSLISRMMVSWRPNRFKVLAQLCQKRDPVDIAEKLDISKQAVYKNINDGALELIMKAFHDIEKAIDIELSMEDMG